MLYFLFILLFHALPSPFHHEKRLQALSHVKPLDKGKSYLVLRMLDALTLLSSHVLFSLYLTLPVIFFSSFVYVCMSELMMGLVSCQVSSLLALSVTQRSDKKEPGVGLSLPPAKEVSFSPSIIHILFNLTR